MSMTVLIKFKSGSVFFFIHLDCWNSVDCFGNPLYNSYFIVLLLLTSLPMTQ